MTDIKANSRPEIFNPKCMKSVADREVHPWEFSRKGKLGGSDVFNRGRGSVTPPNISQIARSLVKSWPRCKRNDHGLFCDFFKLVTTY